MEQHKLAFLRTNNTAILEQAYDARIVPESACHNVIQRIENTSDLSLRSHLARFDWHNCVWSAARNELGPYPLDKWKSFLASHGIQERDMEQDVDD
jgi:hypothetical protein